MRATVGIVVNAQFLIFPQSPKWCPYGLADVANVAQHLPAIMGPVAPVLPGSPVSPDRPVKPVVCEKMTNISTSVDIVR